MSAFPSLKPSAPSDRPTPIPLPPRSAARRWTVGALTVVFAAAAVYFVRSERRSEPSTAPMVRTVKALRGVVVRSTRLTGTITAKKFASITAPLLQAPDAGRGLVLLYLPENGARVRKGQRIALIDTQAVQDHLDD